MTRPAQHDMERWAVPSTPMYNGEFRRFYCEYGLIRRNLKRRSGGVWNLERTFEGLDVFYSCPDRACKTILKIPAEDIDSRGFSAKECIVCDGCREHMWLKLVGWRERKKKLSYTKKRR